MAMTRSGDSSIPADTAEQATSGTVGWHQASSTALAVYSIHRQILACSHLDCQRITSDRVHGQDTVLRAAPTPPEAWRRTWARSSAEERAAFRAEVAGPGG